MHVVVLLVIASYAPPLAIAAMLVLLARAMWGVAHDAPPAKIIGWREIAYGAVTVALVAIAY